MRGLSGELEGFWFFDRDNVELVVKVLDGRPINGRYWVFFGSLTDVAFHLMSPASPVVVEGPVYRDTRLVVYDVQGR